LPIDDAASLERPHWVVSAASAFPQSLSSTRYDPLMAATLEELEARIAALEAERVDYRAVLTAVNALGANQREHAEQLRNVGARLTVLEDRTQTIDDRTRSMEENLAEVKDLLVRTLDR
jgi:ABC-type transporter Mla subunit MlaD